jgi:hypothetical protein
VLIAGEGGIIATNDDSLAERSGSAGTTATRVTKTPASSA